MITTELEKIEDKKQSLISEEKAHPWRLCSTGTHFVKKHIVHMPPSAEHPNGQTVERHEHCALNPSKKDILSFDEIQEITMKHFPQLLDPSANICAGIRWLFRKKVIADSKLGRKSTWIEAVAEYKGVLYLPLMSFRLLCYRFSRLLRPKRFAIEPAIPHLFGHSKRKNQVAQNTENSLVTSIKQTPPPAVIERFLHLYFCTTNACSL